MRAALIWLGITLFACSAPACWSASSFPEQYDAAIRAAAKRYLPGVDWRLGKAQLFQESRLDPDAISPVGARGLAQFMPGTWAEVSRAIGRPGTAPQMAGPAIEAWAYYMGKLRASWSAPRPEIDRYSLALASYNAGLGSLLRAQKLASGAAYYSPVARKLPLVTGRYAQQTLVYVFRIWNYWERMVLGN